jgi:hypothetical protein
LKKKRKIDQKINRQEALEQGFYDGRFKPKVITDKKKQEEKDTAGLDFFDRFKYIILLAVLIVGFIGGQLNLAQIVSIFK